MDHLFAQLGIPSNSSLKDINNAYHHLAKQYHPDRNSDPLANKLFQNISSAYRQLVELITSEEAQNQRGT